MARRESQGLQITLIIFVMLTVILAVTTYIFWSRSGNLAREVATLQKDNGTLKAAADQAIDNATQLKELIGHSPDTAIEAIKEQFNRDMLTYAGDTLPEVQRTYKELPAYLLATIQDRHQQINTLDEQVKRLTQELDKTKQQSQQEIAEAKRIQAESEAALRKTRDEFAGERDRLNQEKGQFAQQIDQSRTAMTELETKSQQQIDALQKQVKNKDLILEQREEQLTAATQTSFEVPDGKITWVNPKTGMVYINLGCADGLRRQVTFSVYGTDVNNLVREEKKGSIEVTRVIDDHLSEARTTEDDPKQPILPGDVIFTPLWNSDSALHFALVGVMDIDGNGTDDRELIRRLVTLNSGTIDAEDVDGEVKGQITNHTRYIVRGDAPGAADEGDDNAVGERQNAYTQLMRQASDFGVEQLSLEKLLDFVGYDGEKRTIPLGQDARPEDFPALPEGGVLRSSTGNAFKEREPPVRRSGS